MYITAFRNGASPIQRHWNTKTQIQTHTNFNIFVGRLIGSVFFILIVLFILDLWWCTNYHRATYNLFGKVKLTCLECGRERVVSAWWCR